VADPDVVGLGYPTGALWIEYLQAAALSLDDSAALMTAMLKEA
jgi:hypothetical protein